MEEKNIIEIKKLTKSYKLYCSKKARLLEVMIPKYNNHTDFKALDNLDLNVKKGEIVGILGRNGAGKSTLLKIITGVASQTSGEIKINGKISSLLELGTAFNPELTGEENIYQHGQIMGLTKEKIESKKQEIINFADIGDHLYQPVKTYSSGMFARLAFACAINVDPDILIVDEVLSVGDIAFIISILVSITLVGIMPNKIWNRFPIFSIILMFIFLHDILPLKEMYEFIYKKRYLIALLVYAYIIVMGYSGSSIGMYRYMVQLENDKLEYGPILGISKSIRSDEWNVNTPIYIPQSLDNEGKFLYYNDNLRGTSTDMFSVISAPVSDILILAKPFFIGFLLFGAKHGLAFFWYGKVIALMLISFELCMLISDRKKLISLLGMVLITFSAATQWWNMTEYIIWGGLALVLLDKFMLTDKYKIKIFCAFGIFISAISYIFILYPAWQVPFAYTFLPILIWIIWKNRKEYKMNWKDVLIILIVILAVAGIEIRYYSLSKDTLNIVMNTSYPGQRFEKGGDARVTLFSYVYSMFFPYQKNMNNPCELSGMISIYPIPMIVALLFLIRSKDRKKHFAFLIPMLLVGCLLSYWCLHTTSEMLAKVTFLYMSPAARTAVPLGFLQILLIIYVMGNAKETDKITGKNIAKILAVIFSVEILSVAIKTDREGILGNLRSYICGLILVTEIYLLFTINKEESKKALIALLIPIALITGATVNPIQKGISVLTDKPVAKKSATNSKRRS